MENTYLFKSEITDDITIRTIPFTFIAEYKSGILRKEKGNEYDSYKKWGNYSNKNPINNNDEDYNDISNQYMQKRYEFFLKKGEKIAFLVNED